MKLYIDPLTILNILLLIFCFSIAVFYIFTKKGDRRINVFGAVFILTGILCSCFNIIIKTKVYLTFPVLIYSHRLFLFLLGPSFYFYFKSHIITQGEKLKKIEILHLLPFFIYSVLLVPEYIHSIDTQIYYFERGLYSPQGIFFVKVIIPVIALHILTYAVLIIFNVYNNKNLMKENFSDLSKWKLAWMKKAGCQLWDEKKIC